MNYKTTYAAYVDADAKTFRNGASGSVLPPPTFTFGDRIECAFTFGENVIAEDDELLLVIDDDYRFYGEAYMANLPAMAYKAHVVTSANAGANSASFTLSTRFPKFRASTNCKDRVIAAMTLSLVKRSTEGEGQDAHEVITVTPIAEGKCYCKGVLQDYGDPMIEMDVPHYYTKDEIDAIAATLTGYTRAALDAKLDIDGYKDTILGWKTAVEGWYNDINNWQSEVSQNKTAVAEMKTAVEGWKSTISGWYDSINGWQQQMTTDKTAVEGWKNAVKGWHDQIETWHGQINTWQADVSTKHGEVSGWRNDISGWKASIETWYGQVSQWYAQIDAWRQQAAASASAASVSAGEAAESARVALAIAHIEAPACTNMGIVLSTTSATLTWEDPTDMVIDGWKGAAVARTIAVLKIGSMPEDYTDGVIVAATSRSPETDTFPLPEGVSFAYLNDYRDTGIAVPVEDSDTVCIKLFTCATNGAWNNLPANEYPTYTTYSWGQLSEYADAGTFLQHIPLGSALDMEHKDFPQHQWIVAGEDCFFPRNPASGHHHVALLSRRVLFTAPCDAPESQWGLTWDTAAVTGITYGLNISGTFVQLAEGTDWEAGDTSVTYDGVEYPISEWYEKNPNTSYSSGTNFTPQRNDIQWMNADGKGGDWFEKQNPWDTCNTSLAARNGFLRNLPEVFRNAMLECIRTCYVYTSYRKRGIGASTTFNAVCFPLNLYEIFKTVVGSITEGRKQLEWFEGGASAIAYLVDGTTASTWWSASAVAYGASYVGYVTAAGTSASYYASSAYGFRPACAFGKRVSL